MFWRPLRDLVALFTWLFAAPFLPGQHRTQAAHADGTHLLLLLTLLELTAIRRFTVFNMHGPRRICYLARSHRSRRAHIRVVSPVLYCLSSLD